MNFNQIQFPKTEHHEKETMEIIIEKLILEAEQRQESIGEGRTAKVLMSETDDTFCLKSVHKRIAALNDVKKEMYFLEKLQEVNIRTSSPVCTVSTEENDYLVMETIQGISLDDLLIRNKIDKLPDGFDIIKIRSFFKELKEMVEKMNNLGIYHLDLHFGNIMINEKGQPVIIDLGDAKEIKNSSENPYAKVDAEGKTTTLPTDLNNIQKAFIETQKYLKEAGYFDKFKSNKE